MPLDDLTLDDILADRQLGSKSSKSKSKSKDSKSKSKKKSKKKSSSSGKKDKKSSSDKKRKDSSKSDSSKKKKNKTPEMSDITKELVTILKDRKNVVNGKDKTKALDQKDLRNKVLDELGVKDSDRGEAKKMFEDAIEKLEKKDEIVLDIDGDVKILVSMDDSNSDDKKKKSGSLELTDVAREVVSILKDRKNVVNGEDITKTLDQKKLRDKVMNELDVSDSDRGEAKELFEEALKKLENKDEIKFDEDGDVKIHVSMDHSKESRSGDEKGQIFEQATVDENSSEASGINKIDNDDQDGAPLITVPSEPTPIANADSIIFTGSNETEPSDANRGSVDPDDNAYVPTGTSDEAKIDLPTDVTSAGTNTIGGKTDNVPNDAENVGATANTDSSTVNLSGKSNKSCGAGCKAGVSFAGVGLLVGVGVVAAKMVKAKNNEEDDDFESDEEEDNEEGIVAEDDTPTAAEENV